MKFSLKFALVGLLLFAAVANCQKKKKGSKKSKGGAGALCPTEMKSDNKNFPHQMTITNSGTNKICGATWVSENIVITAGHCVVDSKDKKTNAALLSAQLGIRNRGLLAGGEARNIEEVELHKGFKRLSAPSTKKGEAAYFTNDIAVLKLAKPGIFANRKLVSDMEGKFAVLPEGKDAPTEGTEVGFLTPGTGLFEMKSVNLWERTIKMMEKAECVKAEEMGDAKADVEAGKTLCGQELDKCEVDEKICDRMTGGGLVCKGDVLCGIQTVHHCDDDEHLPQGYLNVAEYKEWIEKKIEKFEE